MDTNSDSSRRLTAAEVNELAQALDEGAPAVTDQEPSASTGPAGAVPASPSGSREIEGLPSAVAQTEGDNPLAAEEREEQLGMFPPDIAPTVDIGGSLEEQAALREEYRQS